MIGELNHRAGNLLAVISAVAMQTLDREVDMPALQKFLAWLKAMSRTYKLLTRMNWRQTPLRELVTQQLLAVVDPIRFRAEGPTVILNAKATVALGMTLHELTTNVVKYGALSNSHGQVSVVWSLDPDESLTMHWTETDGPAVGLPDRRGFGSMLIERQLAFELHGKTNCASAKTVSKSLCMSRLPRCPNRRRKHSMTNERGKPLVLIVEDELMIALTLEMMLSDQGCEIAGPRRPWRMRCSCCEPCGPTRPCSTIGWAHRPPSRC